MVGHAAHVIGQCDRAAIVTPLSDIAASIGQLCRLGIAGKPYLVSPENEQRIDLAFGVVQGLGKKPCFRPARVRLFSHTIREHHATSEC